MPGIDPVKLNEFIDDYKAGLEAMKIEFASGGQFMEARRLQVALDYLEKQSVKKQIGVIVHFSAEDSAFVAFLSALFEQAMTSQAG
jgi:hypothetical protein